MQNKIKFLILLTAMALPVMVSAQGEGITIQSMIDAAVLTTLYIASGIVVILWVVTGFLFLTAQGDPTKLTAAKKALLYAVIGTAVILVAQGAIYLVGSAFGIQI